jgi:iron(II)-dependent oxidoreductase
VSWFGALAYCQWLSERTGRSYALPNEAQWEKACRGGKNYLYPWGDELDTDRSNFGRSVLADVDAYPPQNEFSLYDLVGNVCQWTLTLWGEKRLAPDPQYRYPWKDDRRNDPNANRQIRRVVRGGSFQGDPGYLRCSAKSGEFPDDPGLPGSRYGFRVVLNM